MLDSFSPSNPWCCVTLYHTHPHLHTHTYTPTPTPYKVADEKRQKELLKRKQEMVSHAVAANAEPSLGFLAQYRELKAMTR